MQEQRNYITRYSEAFKQKVLQEIETGYLTPAEAVRKYGIGHCATINYWMKQLKRFHLLRKVVRIEMPGEIRPSDIIKKLKAEKQQLESALAQSQIKVIALETLIDTAQAHYKIDIKKKFGAKPLSGHYPELKKRD